MGRNVYLAACMWGAIALTACGVADRAEFPRGIVSKDTIGAAVLDLEALDLATVDPWLEAFDPKGEHLPSCDRTLYHLEALAKAGGKRLVLLVDVSGELQFDRALLLHAKQDAEALDLLQALWLVFDPEQQTLAGEDLALSPWQPSWWLVEMPGLRQPIRQEQELGAHLQTALAAGRGAPFRAVLALSPEQRDRSLGAIGGDVFTQALLGGLAGPAREMTGLSLALDTRTRSPRIRLRVDFEAPETARKFEAAFDLLLASLQGTLRDLVRVGIALQGAVPTQDPTQAEDWLALFEQGLGHLRLAPQGSSSTLVLDRTFFQTLRHLRNVQDQVPSELVQR